MLNSEIDAKKGKVMENNMKWNKLRLRPLNDE